jgi:hypothetical protein
MSLICLTIWAVFLAYGCAMRLERSADEKIVRFGPIARALKETPENSWLITDEPIIAALASKGQRNIVDYTMLGRGIDGSTLAAIVKHFETYLLVPEVDFIEPDSRHGSATTLLSSYVLQKQEVISAGSRRYVLTKVLSE